MTKIGLICSLHHLHVQNLLAKDWRILNENRLMLNVRTSQHDYRKVLGLRFVFSIHGDFCLSQNSRLRNLSSSVKLFQRSIWIHLTLQNWSRHVNQTLVVSWQFLMYFGTPDSATMLSDAARLTWQFLSWKGWCATCGCGGWLTEKTQPLGKLYSSHWSKLTKIKFVSTECS